MKYTKIRVEVPYKHPNDKFLIEKVQLEADLDDKDILEECYTILRDKCLEMVSKAVGEVRTNKGIEVEEKTERNNSVPITTHSDDLPF